MPGGIYGVFCLTRGCHFGVFGAKGEVNMLTLKKDTLEIKALWEAKLKACGATICDKNFKDSP
ncbi:hypothetical protein NHP21005_00370 [Helicobacter sp. NHP21005]|nr:hypothetical protein NHP21005_00370 [Helicobacter sp. NHP21005]